MKIIKFEMGKSISMFNSFDEIIQHLEQTRNNHDKTFFLLQFEKKNKNYQIPHLFVSFQIE